MGLKIFLDMRHPCSTVQYILYTCIQYKFIWYIDTFTLNIEYILYRFFNDKIRVNNMQYLY